MTPEKPPWRWEKFSDSYDGLFWALKDAEGKTIFHLVDDEDYMTEQRRRLIAAAPKMLELLELSLTTAWFSGGAAEQALPLLAYVLDGTGDPP